MRIAWIGLGKLGNPIAGAIQKCGHRVTGWDVSERAREGALVPVGSSLGETVANAELVFVAVQTPHAPAFEGTTPLTDERRDFEYGFLVSAVRDCVHHMSPDAELVVISTVLPGTWNNHLRQVIGAQPALYNPFFIAMGTEVEDFLNPEFVLMGRDADTSGSTLQRFYGSLHDQPLFFTSIETAELTKVAYNAAIGIKVVLANTLMEVCHKTGADCDAVIDALSLATDRLISPRYLRGGMGDGGGCHPRDNIAMSWLARKLDLSFDLFGTVMEARECQTEWLASEVVAWADLTGLPIAVLGKSYKAESSLTIGSPAALLVDFLNRRDRGLLWWDPYVDQSSCPLPGPRVCAIATNHPEFVDLPFAPGSVVLDPWGYIPDREGVTVVRIGRKS